MNNRLGGHIRSDRSRLGNIRLVRNRPADTPDCIRPAHSRPIRNLPDHNRPGRSPPVHSLPVRIRPGHNRSDCNHFDYTHPGHSLSVRNCPVHNRPAHMDSALPAAAPVRRRSVWCRIDRWTFR